MLERQHLAILFEVDRLGSVTAAARQLNLTQSALSHAIRKLEERCGTALWEKDGRQLRLTQAGEYVLKLSKRILPQLERAEQVLEDIRCGQRGALVIGMECHPCHQWLMGVIQPYLAAWPDVDIDLKTAFHTGGVADLLAHDIDILITPDPYETRHIHFTPVFAYELVLAVPEYHTLARAGFAQPQDLLSETLITYPIEPERLDIFTQFLLPQHCYPSRHRTVETTEMMLQLVAAGRGISAIPDWLLHERSEELNIRTVRIGRNGIHKNIHLGIRAGEDNTDYIAGFLDTSRANEIIKAH